jgi:hypothetical protein
MPDVARQRAIKIRDEYDIRSYFLGDERPSGNDRLRSYEAGDLEYLEQSAGSGSRYVYLSDNKTGEKTTIRISDHFAPRGGGYRVDMFGGSGRSERPDYNIVNRKIYEPTDEPYTNGFRRITPQQFREETAGWREAFEKASPAITDGAAGIKTTADKSGMPAEQAGSGSSLTSANEAQPAANVNSQSLAAPRGQAMPDSLESIPSDQLQRQYDENQGYLGLSTPGMREGRPVRGGAAQTRELLRRNEAISAELERRGVRSEDAQLQRALQRRGQAMPDA